MIKFPCHCGHHFGVEDDQAGGTIQCPKCGRLNDIPTLSDLEHIDSEGVYKLDTPPPIGQVYEPEKPPVLPYEEKPDALEKLRRAFGKGYTDDAGDDIDLRPSIDDVRKAGDVEIPLELRDEVLPGAPKYDPETGELIKPHDIAPSPHVDPNAIPVAQRAVNYATSELGPTLTPTSALVMLFQPINLFVMGCILLFHGLLLIVAVILGLGGLIARVRAGVAGAVALSLLLSHYAIVIDHIGPDTFDDLPRPFRHLDWHDDIWGPFYHMFLAILICYFPALIFWIYLPADHTRELLVMAFVVIGTFLFPAVLLTTATSGHMVNLRPDRILGVIATLRERYIFPVLLFPLAAGVYLYGLDATTYLLMRSFYMSPPKLRWIQHPIVAIGALLAGIYLAHYFCVYLGLLYRQYHDEFPWAFQRHIPTKLLNRLKSKGDVDDDAPRPRRRRAGDSRQRMIDLGRDPRNQRRQPES